MALHLSHTNNIADTCLPYCVRLVHRADPFQQIAVKIGPTKDQDLIHCKFVNKLDDCFNFQWLSLLAIQCFPFYSSLLNSIAALRFPCPCMAFDVTVPRELSYTEGDDSAP